MQHLLDFILHLDRHLADLVQAYGPWIYGLLFGIILAETGFVVTPFLPGDSLLFATGALAAGEGGLNAWLLFGLLTVAAFLGDNINYAIGRAIGPRIFRGTGTSGWFSRMLNREHLNRAHEFFEQYGGKAVILARFAPILRTFVPFVAGAASMTPRTFVLYNAVGAAAWVGLCLGAGVAFGNVPIVKNNFSLVTVGIVLVSLIPVAVEVMRARAKRPPAA